MNDDTRRMAAKVALSMYSDEPCRICRQIITVADLPTVVFAGYSRDCTAVAAHRVCWDNFVELLQTTPAQRLHELANGLGEETNEDGQRDIFDARGDGE